MKKRCLATILSGILTTLFCVLAACSEPVAPQDDVYDTLNSLFAQTKDEVTLTVGTTLGGETLNGTFTAVQEENGTHVTYSYEQLSTFEEDEIGYIIPDSYKTTYEGTMLISDGKIVEQDGDAVDIAIEQITAAGLEFDKDYFSDIASSDGEFRANVVAPSDFLQTEIDCSGMRVEVHYTQERIDSLMISYTSSVGAQVEFSYTFA